MALFNENAGQVRQSRTVQKHLTQDKWKRFNLAISGRNPDGTKNTYGKIRGVLDPIGSLIGAERRSSKKLVGSRSGGVDVINDTADEERAQGVAGLKFGLEVAKLATGLGGADTAGGGAPITTTPDVAAPAVTGATTSTAATSTASGLGTASSSGIDMAGGADAMGDAGSVMAGGDNVLSMTDGATSAGGDLLGDTSGITQQTPSLATNDFTPQYQWDAGADPANAGKYASPEAMGDNGMSSYTDPNTGETVTAGNPETGTAGKPIQNKTFNEMLKKTAEDKQTKETEKQLKEDAEKAKKAAEKSKKMKEIMNKGIPLVSSAVEMGVAASAREKAEKKALKDFRKKGIVKAEYDTL